MLSHTLPPPPLLPCLPSRPPLSAPRLQLWDLQADRSVVLDFSAELGSISRKTSRMAAAWFDEARSGALSVALFIGLVLCVCQSCTLCVLRAHVSAMGVSVLRGRAARCIATCVSVCLHLCCAAWSAGTVLCGLGLSRALWALARPSLRCGAVCVCVCVCVCGAVWCGHCPPLRSARLLPPGPSLLPLHRGPL
jgi:hypothetical protein